VALRRVLRAQDGMITRAQAIHAGLTRDDIQARLADGRWDNPYRGVYVLTGIAHSPHRLLRVALAATGTGAAASHRSAAWLWGLTDRPPATASVSVSEDRHPVVPGIDLHRSRLPLAVTARRGLPCTGVARTLTDCATVLPPGGLADLVDRALASRVITVRELDDATTDGGGLSKLPGRRALRHCLADRGLVGGPTPSVLESRMARLFRRHQLPVPRAEVVWGDQRQYRLDFAYPGLRLVVEVDGYAWHASPEQFARDHRRRNELTTAGWTVLVYGWRDVSDVPDRVAGEIAATHRKLAAAVRP
jgi:very-short-patch-repair endonuclease